MKHFFTLVYISFVSLTLFAQQSFIGAGNDNGISVRSSSSSQLYDGVFSAQAENTINGDGLLAKKMEAARFLSQASFGARPELVDEVAAVGIEKWLTKQFNLPPTLMAPAVQEIYQTCFETHLSKGGDTVSFTTRPNATHMDYAWWESVVKSKDILRQRMAYALSEILVMSAESNIGGYGLAMADYYDILIRNAFGNYRDILQEVTLHPAMGVYLSHLNNAKTDTVNQTFPDENYAREVMQLFSIGLNELNEDGTNKLDGSGNAIPTYDNEDIKEFAKIFTGLGIGARRDTVEASFWNSIYIADVQVPMKMYEDYHEPGPKYLLNGFVVPEGQSGEEDVNDALDHLFNHPNVAPFISKRLIQHFVKSNPTIDYVSDVSKIFNDNGAGTKGDLGAVLKAILMHPEARDCEWIGDASQGKLREPIIRFTSVVRQFGGFSPFDDRYWNTSWGPINDLDQHPLHSPTVFNFFNPFYSPNGPISEAGMIAPEFEIHNSRTSINYANYVYYWVEWEYLLNCRSQDAPIGKDNAVLTDLTRLTEFANDSDALLDHLDTYMCHGQLTARTRGIIKEAIDRYPVSFSGIYSRVQLATYLILISPDYTILK
jgi:uncharacterized protein (DUF1800 family)